MRARTHLAHAKRDHRAARTSGPGLFRARAEAVEALGLPVFERDTGGDLTPQEPGIVNLSLAFRMDGEGASIKEAYLR